MIFRECYRVPVDEGHFEKAIHILTNQYGLVNGTGEPLSGSSRVLVWEDEQGIGRYRVHCRQGKEIDGAKYDTLLFQYFVNEKMSREIFEQDPMGLVLEAVKATVQKRILVPHMCCETTIDNFLKES